MQQALAQIYVYLVGLWRFRWYGLALAWTLAICGWLWVWALPVSYTASARLEVDSSSLLRPLLKGLAIQPDLNQRVELMSKTLLSRPNLEKLMRMTDLDLKVNSELEEEKLLSELKSSISLRGDTSNSSLYELSFKHQNRDAAKRVVQSLITIFIESTLGQKRQENTGAQAFLDKQIAEYEARLSESEDRLADFKQKHSGTLPGEIGDYYQRLDVEKSKLNTARLELREMQNRKQELSRQLEGEEPAFFSSDLGPNTSMSPIDLRIQSLKEKLDYLSLNYTDLHPEIIQVKQKIRDLEKDKDKEVSKVMETNTTSFTSFGNNPVFQSMRTMLAESEARIAELMVRVSEYEQRVKELEDTINNIPEIEVELKQLNRDYQVVSQQHNALLQRRESALLSEQVQRSSDDIKFRVVDPPFVPLRPSEPNKLLLNSGVLLLSLAAGIGLATLLTLLRPVFVDRNTMSEKLGLPVLGTVTMVLDSETAKRDMISKTAFSAICLCLFVTFTGVAVGQQMIF